MPLPNLDQIMANDGARSAFRLFLQAQDPPRLNEYNFLADEAAYHDHPTRDGANRIVATYLGDDAPHRIDMLPATRQAMREAVTAGGAHPSGQVFAEGRRLARGTLDAMLTYPDPSAPRGFFDTRMGSPFQDIGPEPAPPAVGGHTTLDDILADPGASAALRSYAERQYAQENLDFLVAERAYRANPTQAAAIGILNRFISEDAAAQVNLPGEQRIAISRRVYADRALDGNEFGEARETARRLVNRDLLDANRFWAADEGRPFRRMNPLLPENRRPAAPAAAPAAVPPAEPDPLARLDDRNAAADRAAAEDGRPIAGAQAGNPEARAPADLAPPDAPAPDRDRANEERRRTEERERERLVER